MPNQRRDGGGARRDPVDQRGGPKRWQCTFAIAQRDGLGDDTLMRGLGDMGSNLATFFDEAFVAYDGPANRETGNVGDQIGALCTLLTCLPLPPARLTPARLKGGSLRC
jgi:hypothetical protein